MKEHSHLLQYNDLQLEYFVWGSGKETIICLHGHSRSAEDFRFLTKPDRKVISLHLFHHGNSVFPLKRMEKNPLQTSEFIQLIEQLIQTEKVTAFHLIAFSQGWRFALSLIPFFAQQIRSVNLIAPDGMDNKSIYNRLSRQFLARQLFNFLENNPKSMSKLGKTATKLKLVRPKVGVFIQEFANDKQALKRASHSWQSFRQVQPDYRAIQQTINKYKISFQVITGKYDQVIRPKQAYAFEKAIGLKDSVIEIENGHNFFKPSSIPKFAHLLSFNRVQPEEKKVNFVIF